MVSRTNATKSNLWSINAGVKYRFNDRHAAKLGGRYSRGKSDYTEASKMDLGESTGYGSATLKMHLAACIRYPCLM